MVKVDRLTLNMCFNKASEREVARTDYARLAKSLELRLPATSRNLQTSFNNQLPKMKKQQQETLILCYTVVLSSSETVTINQIPEAMSLTTATAFN